MYFKTQVPNIIYKYIYICGLSVAEQFYWFVTSTFFRHMTCSLQIYFNWILHNVLRSVCIICLLFIGWVVDTIESKYKKPTYTIIIIINIYKFITTVRICWRTHSTLIKKQKIFPVNHRHKFWLYSEPIFYDRFHEHFLHSNKHFSIIKFFVWQKCTVNFVVIRIFKFCNSVTWTIENEIFCKLNYVTKC